MGNEGHYIIDLSRLPVGTHRFDLQLNDAFFESLEKSEVLRGNVAVEITLNLREEDYLLAISVHGTVFVVCDRCLEPMPLDINVNDEMIDSLDAAELPDGELDLSWLAYEIVSINIPLVHSHQAGECDKQMELLLHDHLCTDVNPEIDNL